MKIIYLAHPLGAEEPARTENIARGLRWYHWLVNTQNAAVLADWLLTAMTHDETARDLGMRLNQALLALADEVWLCGGRVSAGMEAEAVLARSWGIPVMSLLHVGAEPPVAYSVAVPPMPWWSEAIASAALAPFRGKR